jgi:maltooligosyltrehalose synthase
MYMDFDFDVNKDFVFTTDKNGILKGGGFTITSDLLNDTIRNSNVNSSTNHLDKKNMDSNIQQGGNSSVGANVLSMFKDLAVPAGLFFTQTQIQKNNTIRYQQKEEPIEDGLYDKLLGLLDPVKRMLHGRKTKHKRENNKKKTRKVRK